MMSVISVYEVCGSQCCCWKIQLYQIQYIAIDQIKANYFEYNERIWNIAVKVIFANNLWSWFFFILKKVSMGVGQYTDFMIWSFVEIVEYLMSYNNNSVCSSTVVDCGMLSVCSLAHCIIACNTDQMSWHVWRTIEPDQLLCANDRHIHLPFCVSMCAHTHTPQLHLTPHSPRV